MSSSIFLHASSTSFVNLPSLENNSTNVNPAGKNNLKNWLYYCGRYLFEDQIEGMNGTKGVEKFSKYYKFLYGDSSDPTKI